MIGTQIASYRILEKLGEGGMGTVYKAIDTSLDRMVAIKVLSSDLAGNPELVQRFRAEAKAQANLNHTNLATLYAFVVEDNRACMVMELIDGETFEQMILRQGPLPAEQALPLFKQALLGIGYAHRAGIVHRDIKPSNIMLNRMGIVKVMDFGIAKVMGARGMTKTGTQMGTGWYMSPEQVLNRPVDIRSDIYSLGVTLYQMITAHVPFDGPSEYQIMTDHVNTPPPLPTHFAPNIPKGVENAVLKSLDKNPDARFQTVEEFGAALERPNDFGAVVAAVAPIAAAAVPVAASQMSVARVPAVSFLATPQRKVIAGAGGLVVLLLAGWLFARSRNQAPVTTPSLPDSSTSAQPSGNSIPPLPDLPPQPPPPVRKSGPAAPQITFSVFPTSIRQGAIARLRWRLTNTSSANIIPAPGVLRQTAGEFSVSPRQTTTYTLTAASKDGATSMATATVQVIPGAQPALPNVAFVVHHDHGLAPNPALWPQCWGQLVVVGNRLQYRVLGTDDGRRDDFNVLMSQLQDVRLNRVLIRNLPAFHVTINGRVFNFVPQGTTPAQVVFALQQRINAR